MAVPPVPSPSKPRVRVQAGSSLGAVATADSFQNFVARVGIGTGNQSSASTYGFNPISRNRTLLEWMYRGSWICRRAVDIPAEDMTRNGVEFKGLPQGDQDDFQEGLNGLGVWSDITDALRWARLFGGSAAIINIDGQDPASPLDATKTGKDQFLGLSVADRWVAWPRLGELVTDPGPGMGLPKFYDLPGGMPGFVPGKYHHTRVLRFEGDPLPYFQRWYENLWGASVLEVIYDRLVMFDSTTQGAAQLVYKAHLRTMKVQKLREIISAGGNAYAALIKQMEMIRQFQTNEGMSLIDGEDDLQVDQYAFSGLDDVLRQCGQQLCGALKIPYMRLFGESPGGLNSTGDAELQVYDEGIVTDQKQKLRPGLHTLFQVAYRSVLGAEPKPDFGFKFKPLREMTDSERADIADKESGAIVGAFTAQVVPRAVAMRELRQSGETSGVWSTITDEEIKEAENDPPLSELAQTAQESAENMANPPEPAEGEGGPPAPAGEKPEPKPGGNLRAVA